MGSLFLAVGVLGFSDGFVSPPDSQDPTVTVQELYGRLFGVFPVNILHSVVHGVIGLAGLLAWRNVWSPQAYARFVGGFYAILTVMGLIPGFDTMMGLVPIFGHDVWLHALSSAAGIYFGWVYSPARLSAQQPSAIA